MWLTIVGSLIELLTPFAEKSLIKKLREHSDQLIVVERKLNIANAAFMDNTDNRDDLEFVALMKEKKLLMEAMQRDLALAQKQT
jgi:uncharacterized UPF0160 family protein